MDTGEAQRRFERIAANIEAVMRGQHASVRKLLAAFAGGGHVLIEDTPGTGKTTLAKALAASVGAKFTRVQFTPDLLHRTFSASRSSTSATSSSSSAPGRSSPRSCSPTR